MEDNKRDMKEKKPGGRNGHAPDTRLNFLRIIIRI